MEEPVGLVIPRPYLVFIRDPFHFISAHESFLFGLLIMLLTGYVGSLTNTHFDGVLDIHTGALGPLWAFLAPGYINWLSLALPLYLAAWILAGKRMPMGDMLGYQAFARAPMLVAVLFSMIPAFQQQALHPTILTADTIPFTVVVLVFVAMIVFTVVWMYRGFARVAQRRGAKTVGAFVVSLIVGEFISKAAFYYLILPALTHPTTGIR